MNRGSAPLLLAHVLLRVSGPATAEPIVVPAPPAEEIRELTCDGRFTTATETTPVTDLRWVDEDSVLVSYALDGIVQHELRPGLPKEAVLRLNHKKVRRAPILGIARSSRYTWAQTGTGESAGAFWPSAASSPKPLTYVRSHGFHEVALVEETLYALGTPGPPEWDEGYDIVLWSSPIREDRVGPFHPVFREPVLEGHFATEIVRRSSFVGVSAGSLRQLDDESLILFPGYDALVRRISLGGALLEGWDLSALGVGGKRADRTLIGGDGVPSVPRPSIPPHRITAWNQLPVVDEVLSIQGAPAVVVRTTDKRGAAWRLGILHSKGATWYRIPAMSTNPSARLRIDANERGRLVLVVGDRILPWKDRRERTIEVLVCPSPN